MGLFGSKIKTETEIKEEVIKKLKKQGVSYNDDVLEALHLDTIQLKDVEDVKKRAMANMLAIQLACSIRNGEDYSKSLLFIIQTMQQWGLSMDDYLPKERLLLHNKYTQNNNDTVFTPQDIIDIAWTYEAYWALLWALDSITDKELIDASKICNTERAMSISGMIGDFDSLRTIDKIKEKIYLFYCYQWAFDEKHTNAEISTGRLKYEIVVERRRGLEWLISEENDWFNLSLATLHNIQDESTSRFTCDK